LRHDVRRPYSAIILCSRPPKLKPLVKSISKIASKRVVVLVFVEQADRGMVLQRRHVHEKRLERDASVGHAGLRPSVVDGPPFNVTQTWSVGRLPLLNRASIWSRSSTGRGPVHIAGRTGDVVIEDYPLPDDGNPVDSSTRLGFTVGNVDEVIRALEGTGAKIVTPPKDTAWGFQVVVKDPDGRSVELTQLQ
jgi:lactoylglutathione lyase